jgi:putative Mn2+ efflux pump MntP
MRRVSIFISSIVMLVAGLYLVVDEFFWETRIFGVALIGGTILVVLGAYLLWSNKKLAD